MSDLLSKGPNFAVTQKISSRVILEAEKGVERLAYAVRWQDAKRRLKEMRIDSMTVTPTTIRPDTSNGCLADSTVRSNSARPTRCDSDATTTTTTTTTTETNAAPAGSTVGAGGTEATGAPVSGTTAAGGTGQPGAPRASVTDAPAASGAHHAGGGTGATRAPVTDAATAGDGNHSTQTTNTAPGKSSRRAGLSFRFPDTDKRLPPPSNVEMERKLKQLKDDIVKSYASHNTKETNASKEQLQFLDKLRSNEDVVIKQSDKCKGLVILDKSDYLDKSHTILDDRKNYEVLGKNPVPKVEAETKRVFKATAKDKIPESTLKELTPAHSRIPVFYGLPKDHKDGVPLRPVISACGGPTEKMSCLLERILKQLLKYVPTHLWDTGDFLAKLAKHSEEHGIPDNSIFFSIDVINLYGSIPISEAIDAVCETLDEHVQEVDTFGLTRDDIRSLLEHCLQKNVFSFDNKFYRQTLGIAMGNPCAPPVAIIFLHRFESHAVESANVKPSFLVRYIYDYAGIWTHGEESLLDFLAYLNSASNYKIHFGTFWRRRGSTFLGHPGNG